MTNHSELIGIVQDITEPQLQSFLKEVMNLMNEQKREIAELKVENQELNKKLDNVPSSNDNQDKDKTLVIKPLDSGESDQIDQEKTAVVPQITYEEFDEMRSKISFLESLIKNMKVGDDQFSLQNEVPKFEHMFTESKLEVDYKSQAPTAELLNKILKQYLKAEKKSNPDGCILYPFGARTLNDEFTPKQWITGKTAKIQAKDKSGKGVGNIYDNSFDPANPKEMRVMLGTGAGKSTFFLRCVAHGGKDNTMIGATLVVPYSSLVGSVLKGHNKWLSLGKDTTKDENGKTVVDPEKRVTVCPLCESYHTAKFDEKGKAVIDPKTKQQVGKYETVHNGLSNLINVFTWWEFLDAWVNDKRGVDGKGGDGKKGKDDTPWIKPWIIFDEAHTDLPCYRALIDLLKEKPIIRPNFKMIEMSATFDNIATSRRLTGTITDYWITDFNKIFTDNPKIFEKKIIMFIDKPSKDKDGKPLLWEKFLPGLKELQKKCKVLILNDAIKDYATDIIMSMEAPLIAIASRDYSVGFSFGDVNVISTGISKRVIRVGEIGKWTKDEVIGSSAFDDLLQERGRAARNKTTKNSVWLSLVPAEKAGKYNLVEQDTSAKALRDELKKGKIEKSLVDLTAKLVEHYSKPEPLPPIDPEDGKRYLNLVLVGFLKQKLENPTKLFQLLPSESKKQEPGKVVFESKLMRFFEKDKMTDILIKATEEKIKSISEQYEDWFLTPETTDDHVYNNEKDAKDVGFLLQAREEGRGYEIEVETTENKEGETVPIKLTLKFKPYKFDKKKLAV